MGRALAGPIVVFFAGLIAWLFVAPRIDDGTVAELLTWVGIFAVIAALVWAAVIAYRLSRGRGSRDRV